MSRLAKLGLAGMWPPDRQWAPLPLAVIHTECLRTGLDRDVCRWRRIAPSWCIRRPGFDSHSIGRLLSAQEIPVAIVFYNLGPTELMLDVSAAGPGRLKR